MKPLYIILIICSWLAACSKDAVDKYGDESFVFFVNKGDDTSALKPVEYSFAFHPGADKDTIPLLVKLMGKLKDENRAVAITVAASQTTAIASDYQLPATLTFRAGRALDTLLLVLNKSDRLKTSKFKIRIALQANEHFSLGPLANQYADITFSDMIARPDWWTSVVETNFLDKYSDTKYRLFIEATGVADMTGLAETEQRAYAIIFRDFLARGRENGEQYVDENGQINVSPNLF
ncbi:MAG: DUF4843 domain-containing protein [Pseudobacter sp.]|uniref:DUF4843 domain-containing protein n=1 Tax=Pseudobacter sp. TaxID=2045420 RepID=UPI003F7EBB66